MECRHEDTSDGVRTIHLAGRMDIEGNDRIALRFNALTATGVMAVVVDLAGVEFMSSIGIGTLVTAAKNLARRKGALALCGARPEVLLSLQRTGIPDVIPTLETLDEARARVSGPART